MCKIEKVGFRHVNGKIYARADRDALNVYKLSINLDFMVCLDGKILALEFEIG